MTADLFARLGITEVEPVLLHTPGEPRMGGRYQCCSRCWFILQDFRSVEDRAAGVTDADLPPLGMPVWDGPTAYDHVRNSGWWVPDSDVGRYRLCRPKCGFSVLGVSCEVVSTYDLTFEGCAFCQRQGALLCLGHPACVEHGAGLRGDGFVWHFGDGDSDTGADMPIEMITATYRAVA